MKNTISTMHQKIFIVTAASAVLYLIFEAAILFNRYHAWVDQTKIYSEWITVGRTFCELSKNDQKQIPAPKSDCKKTFSLDCLPDNYPDRNLIIDESLDCNFFAPQPAAPSFLESLHPDPKSIFQAKDFFQSAFKDFILSLAILVATLTFLFLWHKEVSYGWRRIGIVGGVLSGIAGGLIMILGDLGRFDHPYIALLICIYSTVLVGSSSILGIRKILWWIRIGFSNDRLN